MKKARLLGNYVELLAKNQGISISDLGGIIDCTESQVKAFFKGRLLLSYKQIKRLSERLHVSIENLLNGNEEHYNNTVVHCMNQ